MSNPDDPMSWVAKANNDLLCIENNLNHPDVPWDAVCFHAQQTAEKMLKAWIIGCGTTAPRTHDLAALLAEAVTVGAPLSHLRPDCDLLIPFAVAFRYPGVGADPNEFDGKQAVAAARRIYAAIDVLLPPRTP